MRSAVPSLTTPTGTSAAGSSRIGQADEGFSAQAERAVRRSATGSAAPLGADSAAGVSAVGPGTAVGVADAGVPDEYAEDFKAALHEIQSEISDVLVPNCVYRCGCPEMQTCGMYEWWLKFHPDIASTDIQKRYNTYNELFWKVRAKRGNDSGD